MRDREKPRHSSVLDAGFACAWIRYRTEVELDYNLGGELVRDIRHGRELFNRSPLEYEDEIAIIGHMKSRRDIDGDRVGLIGMSHGGSCWRRRAKTFEWISIDHPLHGYVFPFSGPDGEPEVDDTQEEAIDHVISYLKRHLG